MQPAIPGVPEHECGDSRLRVIAVEHCARGMIKIPHRPAVKKRVLTVFYDIKTPALSVPFNKIFLQKEHILPGRHIQIIRQLLPRFRICPVLAVHSSFRLEHIVRNIIDLTRCGVSRRHDADLSMDGRKPGSFTIIFIRLLEQIASRVVRRFLRPGICPFIKLVSLLV